MRTRLAVALVASTLGLSAVEPAGAAKVWLGVSPSKLRPGAAIHVYGNAGSCRVGDDVFAISRLFPGDMYGREGALVGRVLHGGSFLIRDHVRSTLRPGRYAVSARCGGGDLGQPVYVRLIRR